MTPGPDTALVLRVAALSGARRALAAGAGICFGLLSWGLFTSLGLAALLAASRTAYDALRVAGAAYLTYLGVRLLMQLRLKRGTDPDDLGVPDRSQNARLRRDGRWLVRGLLTNLLNPKVGVFYMTFLPQFVPSGADVAHVTLILTAIHVTEGLVWFCMLVVLVDRLGAWIRRGSVKHWIEALTGTAFVGFGAKLAFQREP